MHTSSGGKGLRRRCCFYDGDKSRVVARARQPTDLEPQPMAAAPALRIEARNTDALSFLFGPTDGAEEVVTPPAARAEEDAAYTAIHAVTPVVAGLVATSGVAAGLAAAAPVIVAASGAHTCAAVIGGSALAALTGLAASACAGIRLARQEISTLPP